MAYTTNQLIADAYFATGIVAREFETVSGTQSGDGLNWLNEILNDKTVNESMVPYETTATVNAVIGQEAYIIPNCITINTLTFTKDTVRYAMRYTKRNEYFGAPRTNSINSLPFNWYFERGFGGGTLYIYFEPDQAYPMEIHGIYRMDEVALNQDIELTLDRFYIDYLKYALADRICVNFNHPAPPNVLRMLAKYEMWIRNQSRLLDLSGQKLSTLQRNNLLNYGQINLGRGFTTPG